MTRNDLYMCFDKKMKWYLLNSGFEYVLVAKSCNKNDLFWLFENSLELQQKCKEYYSAIGKEWYGNSEQNHGNGKKSHRGDVQK